MQKLFALSITLAFFGASSNAGIITWSNNLFPTTVSTMDLGTVSKVFLDDTNTYGFTATSLNITNLPLSATVGMTTFTPVYASSVNLAYKLEPPTDEHGLGIMTNTDAEIRLTYALQIDLSAYTTGTASFVIDSIDAAQNEGYRIWGSSTANGPMTLLAQSTNSSGGFVQTQTFSAGTYNFYDITSNTPSDAVASMLVRGVSTGTVPEPASLPVMGLALITLGAMLLRKK